jgi:glycyl-tRNA synthetase beta chain
MPDFLLELRSEEIPARMQGRAHEQLLIAFREHMAQAGVGCFRIELSTVTPRRLTLIARDLPTETPASSEEIKGPRVSAPPQALEGFLRKTGLSREQLTERDGIWFALIAKPGRSVKEVLAEAVPSIIRSFSWPKSMRWGEASASTESLRWVRPLQGIVALFGEEIVEFEIAGIHSGAATVGHRFHHPGVITIGSANDYVEKLRACHVIVDQEERRRLIRDGAASVAAAAGLTLVEDEGLVAENAGLTEWPVPLLGRFDPAFLDVPPEVIQLTMRTNQKYFALNKEGRLAPNFICTANIEASDGGAAIVAGNERVLSARLSDAKFFWEQDLKIPLDDQAAKLSQIVFHEKLGTVADKVERVAKLARWLVEEGIIKSSPVRGGGPAEPVEGLAQTPEQPLHQPSAGPPPRAGEDLADLAERAARLCKADLVTAMVGEFPELQGLIGGYLASAQGENPQVATAIRDHYKPVGQGDEVPTAPVTVAVSLADKLDTLVSFFAIDEKPTGSKDPFAVRRAAVSVASVVLLNSLRANLMRVVERAFVILKDQLVPSDVRVDEKMKVNLGQMIAIGKIDSKVLTRDLMDFFADRLKVQQREAGVRHDLIDAVFALGGEDDLVRLLARVRALQAFVETPEGADLLAGYKRAANILKKEGWAQSVIPAQAGISGPEGAAADGARGATGAAANLPEIPASAGMTIGVSAAVEHPQNKPLSYSPEKEEASLIAALDSAEPMASAAIAAEDFEGAMAALASLRAPVDAFFDKVTVNDPEPAKRAARLALLARMRDAVHAVADFSRIEG